MLWAWLDELNIHYDDHSQVYTRASFNAGMAEKHPKS